MATTRRQSTPSRKKVRVAIIGGGCAGLAAAWQLSKLPGYELHIYERSWRLGGKGASGRDAHGRIHEHGLHIWLGFYENAFRMMRECYDRVRERGWGPAQKDKEMRLAHGSIDEAFFPEPHVGVAGPNRRGDWEVWSGHLPPMKGRPGDPIDAETNPFTLASYLARCFALVRTLMLSVIGPADEAPGDSRAEERSTFDEAIELDFSFDPTRSPRVLIERMTYMLRVGLLTTAAGLLQGVTIFEDWLRTLNFAPQAADTVLEFLEAVATQTRKQLRDVVAVDERVRQKTEIIDLVITIAVGLYRDKVLFRESGLDSINHIDYRDWLTKHGATKTSVNSRFITGIYELVFAYKNGDPDKPALAAGVALRGALRMFFTYRGSMFWRMRSGMGDAVFAPLYKVLREQEVAADGTLVREPVTFHFLHELREINFDLSEKDRRRVTSLTFNTKGDWKELDKLSGTAALDHFGCWPDSGDHFTVATGKKRQDDAPRDEKILRADQDFDAVIFAMGVDDFVKVCERTDFFRRMPPEWDAMRKRVRTVGTKAAQVWLDKDLDELGWHRGSGLISALGPPFGTWADMTHMLASERAWRRAQAEEKKAVPADKVRSVAFFCGVLPEKEVKGVAVEENLRELLSGTIKRLWPNAFRDKYTALDSLVGADGQKVGEEALSEQYARMNFEGSDRYTLALPGSLEHRISPLDRSFTNMTIAGDWTACGLDASCVEAAVMSGMLAAHAITGNTPALDAIVGYHHP